MKIILIFIQIFLLSSTTFAKTCGLPSMVIDSDTSGDSVTTARWCQESEGSSPWAAAITQLYNLEKKYWDQGWGYNSILVSPLVCDTGRFFTRMLNSLLILEYDSKKFWSKEFAFFVRKNAQSFRPNCERDYFGYNPHTNNLGMKDNGPILFSNSIGYSIHLLSRTAVIAHEAAHEIWPVHSGEDRDGIYSGDSKGRGEAKNPYSVEVMFALASAWAYERKQDTNELVVYSRVLPNKKQQCFIKPLYSYDVREGALAYAQGRLMNNFYAAPTFLVPKPEDIDKEMGATWDCTMCEEKDFIWSDEKTKAGKFSCNEYIAKNKAINKLNLQTCKNYRQFAYSNFEQSIFMKKILKCKEPEFEDVEKLCYQRIENAIKNPIDKGHVWNAYNLNHDQALSDWGLEKFCQQEYCHTAFDRNWVDSKLPHIMNDPLKCAQSLCGFMSFGIPIDDDEFKKRLQCRKDYINASGDPDWYLTLEEENLCKERRVSCYRKALIIPPVKDFENPYSPKSSTPPIANNPAGLVRATPLNDLASKIKGKSQIQKKAITALSCSEELACNPRTRLNKIKNHIVKIKQSGILNIDKSSVFFNNSPADTMNPHTKLIKDSQVRGKKIITKLVNNPLLLKKVSTSKAWSRITNQPTFISNLYKASPLQTVSFLSEFEPKYLRTEDLKNINEIRKVLKVSTTKIKIPKANEFKDNPILKKINSQFDKKPMFPEPNKMQINRK